jgi:hypothetical protein
LPAKPKAWAKVRWHKRIEVTEGWLILNYPGMQEKSVLIKLKSNQLF